MATLKRMSTVKSYEDKCATNYSIITNNNWNDAYIMQFTKHDTNDDVDTMHLHSTGRVAYMHSDCTCIFVPQLDDDTAHLFGSNSEHIHNSCPFHPWSTLFDSFLPFYFYLFILFVTVFLFQLELFLELHYTIDTANLRCSAAGEREDTMNAFISPTGYGPILLTFGELNDSSVPFSFMIPSTNQDVDDVALGEMLTAAHRGQVDYCVPGGMSVSQSSSVVFDDQGNLMEREMSIYQLIWCHRKHVQCSQQLF